MPRPMTHRWGKRINPMTAPALLSERTMQLMLTPLHMSVELLPLGLFTEDHAEMIAKLINAMAVNEINNRAKAQGAKRGQRVEIQL